MRAREGADRPPAADAPTFLFTDIEGSTALWEADGPRMSRALAAHDALARRAVESCRGTVVKMTGDGMHAVFGRAPDALAATLELLQALADPAATCGIALRVRCGLHAGAVLRRDNDFFGPPVNRAARIMSAAHGGQVLLSQAVAEAVREELPAAVSLRDLGRVRLKDLSTPEHVYQAVHAKLRQEFPALRSLEATPNNLPQQATSFIGRERELGELARLLAQSRLVTLTGAGGCGKTRLALQLAAEVLERFPDGVWWVELAPLADASLVAQAAATVLGLREEPGKPIARTLTDYASDKRLLLILDNCEHLLDASAQLADALLRHAPDVRILATSREAIGIGGEQTCRVPSLSLPDPDAAGTPEALAGSESMQLFVERARAVRTDFRIDAENAAAVASLCRHLDGIPLAIELAAARVRSLPVEAIETRLHHRLQLLTGGSRTALPRHQTLRSLIDWSYDLLDETERRMLQRLAVFAGGWTLEAAEDVCGGDGIADDEVVDHLTSLADKSLVQVEPEERRFRYRLLEIVRQYAREKLVGSGDGDTARRRHRDHFLTLGEEAESNITGPDQAIWLRRLEDEHENLRAALDFSAGEADPERFLRLCGALQRFWITRGHFAEGREWCALALARPGADKPTGARAKVLNGAGTLAHHQSDQAAAAALLAECLEIERQMSSPPRIAVLLGNMGLVAFEQGDLARAKALHEESLAIMRAHGNRSGIAAAMNNLAGIAHQQGDFTTARALLEEGLAIKRALGDRGRLANSLGNLANVALDQGDFAAARTLYEECLAIMRELGNRPYIATTLDNLGRVAAFQGDYATARAMCGEALALMRELGQASGAADALCNLALVALEEGDPVAAQPMLDEALAIRHARADRRGIAAALSGLAGVAAVTGQPLRAARLWGAAERLRTEAASPLPPIERGRYDRWLGAARAALRDDGAFDRAVDEGRALPLHEAAGLAPAANVAPRAQSR